MILSELAAKAPINRPVAARASLHYRRRLIARAEAKSCINRRESGAREKAGVNNEMRRREVAKAANIKAYGICPAINKLKLARTASRRKREPVLRVLATPRAQHLEIGMPASRAKIVAEGHAINWQRLIRVECRRLVS